MNECYAVNCHVMKATVELKASDPCILILPHYVEQRPLSVSL